MKYVDPDGKSVVGAAIGVSIIKSIVTATAVTGAVVIAGKVIMDVCKAICSTVSQTVTEDKKDIEQYNKAKNEAKVLTASVTKTKLTGSYTITFISGKTYSGKGELNRAIESAAYRSTTNDTMPLAIDWTPADSHSDVFEQEYIRIQENGRPISRNPGRNPQPNYNMI